MAPKRQLIDVEAAKGYVETFMADPILKMAANAVLNNTPRVDAVEVVRCKECHWWRKINAKNGCGICRHEVFSVDDCTVDPVTEPDDFCSYGERREET